MVSLLLSHLSNFNFISWFIIILTEDLLILFMFLKSHMPPMIEDIFLQCCFKRPSSHHPSVSLEAPILCVCMLGGEAAHMPHSFFTFIQTFPSFLELTGFARPAFQAANSLFCMTVSAIIIPYWILCLPSYHILQLWNLSLVLYHTSCFITRFIIL